MKQNVAIFLIAMLAACANAFPTVTNSYTIDATADPSYGWDDFEWQMNGYTDYSLSWTITGLGSLTGYKAAFKMSKIVDNQKVVYVLKPIADVTVSGSNITCSLVYSNVPPDDAYMAELLLTDSTGAANFRSLGRGTIRTVDSLFDDDDGTYTFPDDVDAALYLLKTEAASTYVTSGAHGGTSGTGSVSTAGGIITVTFPAALAGDMVGANNLSDVASAATSRTNLGLGTAATNAASAFATAAQGSNADTAYGWGDHGTEGYLTSEADTLASVVARGGTTTNNITIYDNGTGYGMRFVNIYDVTNFFYQNTSGGFMFTGDSGSVYPIHFDFYGDVNMQGNGVTNATYYGNGSGITNLTELDTAALAANAALSNSLDAVAFNGVGLDDLPIGEAGQQYTVNEGETAMEFTLSSKYIPVRKGSVGTISAGAPVYISGYSVSGWIEVEEADADDADKLPAVGLAYEDITNSDTVRVMMFGLMESIVDTSAWSVNDKIYVGTTVGTLTNVPPSGLDADIQKVAVVARSHAVNGSLVVFGAGRANAVPNLINGVTITNSTYYGNGIGLTNIPAASLTGNIAAARMTNALDDVAFDGIPTALLSGIYTQSFATNISMNISYQTAAELTMTTNCTFDISDSQPLHPFNLVLYTGGHTMTLDANLVMFGSWTPTGTNVISFTPIGVGSWYYAPHAF